MRKILIALVILYPVLYSYSQQKAVSNFDIKKKLFGKWQAVDYSFMNVSGLDDEEIKNHMKTKVVIDSSFASIYGLNYSPPRYEIKKVSTRKFLESNYPNDVDAFKIKKDSVYQIDVIYHGKSPYSPYRDVTEVETYLFDGFRLFIEDNGVIFTLVKIDRTVSRTTR